MTERTRILHAMSDIELAMYAALGGHLPANLWLRVPAGQRELSGDDRELRLVRNEVWKKAG